MASWYWLFGAACTDFRYTDMDVTGAASGPVTNREPFMWFTSPLSSDPPTWVKPIRCGAGAVA
jgi:hypothetical protein